MPTSPTAEYDVDDLPEEENDPDSQEMWEDIGWDDSFAAQLASAWTDDVPRGDFEAADDADENPFWDDSKQLGASRTLRTAISDPGPSKVHASLSRDSSTEEVPVALNSSQAYAVFPEYNQEDIAEADRVERDLIHEDYVEPDGPPSTQAVSESSASRASRTSIASFNSLQDDCGEVKLGKRRAREDDEHAPQLKHSKTNDDAPRVNLRTSKSDPGPSRPKTVVHKEPKPPGFAFIAHDTRAQQLFNELDLAWGVQYELARGASDGRWSWEGMTRDKLEQLRGTNVASAPRVGAIMLPGKARVNSANNSLWEELDREQAAILENKSRGLGYMLSTWMDKPNWYGGQIQQIARLRQSSPSPVTFELTLCKMQMTRSHRFARYLGSRRVLQINVSDVFSSPRLKDFLSQKLVLCGRVYLTFAVKDGKVYAVEVDEDYNREPRENEGDQHRCSLAELVAWYNPTLLNANQPVTKWATRFDLGLSTSIPVILFSHQQIRIIDDEYAPHPPGSKVPAEKIYTDGCGYMNASALKTIQNTLNLSSMPIAVQGRIFGSKGLWTLSPEPEEQSLAADAPVPQIWIRKSQQKIHLTVDHDDRELQSVHLAHFIFDLVAVSRVSTNVHLSKHTIVNLNHNGVPVEVLGDLLDTAVQREMDPLSQTEGPYVMPKLYHAIDNAAHVSSARLQLYAAGAQRALGLSSRWGIDKTDDVIGDTTDITQPSPRSATARYYPGGKPASLAEGMLSLLKAGFTLDEDILYEDLKQVKKGVLSNLLDKMRLSVHGAAEAFLVPDPSGKLDQGEIHFKASSAFLNPPNGYEPRQITGSCLIYRNPARLPSDILKVTAVVIPELSMYTDVIIVPNKGPCSLPSILAGGDVDGDTAICIWESSLVKPFNNPKIYRMAENFLDENFGANDTILTVAALNKQLYDAVDHSTILQRHLLTGFVQSKVGIYSKYHDAAMYMHGYADEKTLRIAHMFNVILDSRKSGHVVNPETFRRDSETYNVKLPSYMDSNDVSMVSNSANALRPPSLGRFVLAKLAVYAEKLRTTHGQTSESVVSARQQSKSGFKSTLDADILHEWKKLSHLSYFADEIPVVKEFVDSHCGRWKSMWQQTPSEARSSKAKRKETKVALNARVREFCAEFNAGPPAAQTRHLREHEVLDAAMATYAYSLKPRFGFCVAFTQLALIKAKAKGISPAIESFDDLMRIPSSAVRVLPQ